ILEQARPDFRAIYIGLCLSGARPGELCRAQISDLQPPLPPAGEGRGEGAFPAAIILKEHKTAGKTGKPRVIPISTAFEATLRASIADRIEGPAFLDRTGK